MPCLPGTPLSIAERQDLVDGFLHVTEWVRVHCLWRPNPHDKGDNHALELAVAGSASAIVTNNVDDFQRTELRFSEVWILRPNEIMKELI